jgi:GAF domain-containing protein
MTKQQKYDRLLERLDSLCAGETDHVSIMATLACELYHTFDSFNWVGFYRNVGNQLLKIGPYQGGHGCLEIPFTNGVCGKCASEKRLLNVGDVSKLAYHIACSATTRSEVVVPVLDDVGDLIAVLDIDSDTLAAFDDVDEANLQKLNKFFRREK